MMFQRFVTRFQSVGFCLAVVALCLASQILTAQTQGRITGRVTDASGAVIVGAKVTIENVGKKVQRVLETNGSGDYVAPGLEPGLYSVTVEAPNFKKAVRDHVQIEVRRRRVPDELDLQVLRGNRVETVLHRRA